MPSLWQSDESVSDLLIDVECVLNFTQLHSLAVQFDLIVFPTNEADSAIFIVSNQVSSLIHTSLSHRRIRIIEERSPRRIVNEHLVCLGFVLDILAGENRTFEEEFSRTSHRRNTVMV